MRFISNLMHSSFWLDTFPLNRDVFDLIFFSSFLKFRLKLNVVKIKIVLKTFSVSFLMCINVYEICIEENGIRKLQFMLVFANIHHVRYINGIDIVPHTTQHAYMLHVCTASYCLHSYESVNLHLTRSCTPTFHILSALVCNSFCGSVREMR